MKDQIIHTLVISAAILGAGFVIGTIVKDKPQAVTEAKPAIKHNAKKKQTEPAQVVKVESNNELIKELVIANSELKEKIAEHAAASSERVAIKENHRRMYNAQGVLITHNRKLKENFQGMVAYATHISKLNFGYGIHHPTRNPKGTEKELKYLADRIKSLKDKNLLQQSVPDNGEPAEQSQILAERKLLIIALEFRQVLVQMEVSILPHPFVGMEMKRLGKRQPLTLDVLVGRAKPPSGLAGGAGMGADINGKGMKIDPATGLPIGGGGSGNGANGGAVGPFKPIRGADSPPNVNEK